MFGTAISTATAEHISSEGETFNSSHDVITGQSLTSYTTSSNDIMTISDIASQTAAAVMTSFSTPPSTMTSWMTTDSDSAGGGGSGGPSPTWFWFIKVGYLPMLSFGSLGNALSLWVWSAETVYNSSIFMLMTLAIWDGLYCAVLFANYVSFLMEITARWAADFHNVMLMFILLTQVGSINTTLMSSVTRLVAVYRPTTFNQIFSKPRTLALCVAIFLWSLALVSMEMTWIACNIMNKASDCRGLYTVLAFYRQKYVFDYLAYCVPTLLLFVCNTAMVVKVCQSRQRASGGPPANPKRDGDKTPNPTKRGADKTTANPTKRGADKTPANPTKRGADKTPTNPTKRGADKAPANPTKRGVDKTRRLTITMLTISVTSLLTYPVAVTTRLALDPYLVRNPLCDVSCYLVATYTCALLVMVNSSVNVVYYCAISTRFLELLKVRVGQLCACFGVRARP